MKHVVKVIAIVIVSLIILPFVVALFARQDFKVIREVTINQPREVVFDYIVKLQHQHEYGVWSQTDPDMRAEFHGVDGTVGFISAWFSETPDVGRGEQEIINIIPGEKIEFELRHIEPFENTSHAYMTAERICDTTTRVQWCHWGRMSYPMNLMLLLDYESVMENNLQSGLINLKHLLESKR